MAGGVRQRGYLAERFEELPAEAASAGRTARQAAADGPEISRLAEGTAEVVDSGGYPMFHDSLSFLVAGRLRLSTNVSLCPFAGGRICQVEYFLAVERNLSRGSVREGARS